MWHFKNFSYVFLGLNITLKDLGDSAIPSSGSAFGMGSPSGNKISKF